MRTLTVVIVIAAGLVTAACDACGRFPWEPKGPAACRPAAPPR